MIAKRGRVLGRLGRATVIALTWALLLAVIVPTSASAQTFKSLYSFTGGKDGGLPEGPLIWDEKGNLYGTAALPATEFCSSWTRRANSRCCTRLVGQMGGPLALP